VAPLLALVGLVLIAAASLWAMSFLDATIGETAEDATAAPVTAEGDGPGSEVDMPTADPVPDATAAPIVEPPSDERADVKGSILFTRAGDIWAASGTSLRRLTQSDSIKSDSSPAWSPDGEHIYFIRTTKRTTSDSRPGGKYTLYPTDLMRVGADGGRPRKVYDALIRQGGLWFSHVLQPTVGPTGTVAVVSDGPNGSADEVTLHVINSKNGRMRKVATGAEPRLGHNDPAFSPDGRKIAFTYNDNAGTTGRPRIGILTCKTRANCSQGRTKYLKPGYANPSWSPDGKLLAVESTDGTGRDIVVVNARRGDVVVELTRDGDSFAPTFSPAGDQIAYLHRDGLAVDLRVMTLEYDERGRISMIEERPVTSDGGIDAHSAPSWFIPPDELPVLDDGEGDPATGVDPAADASAEPAEDAGAADDDAPPPPPSA
jgi:Tol biopolymer transport system component